MSQALISQIGAKNSLVFEQFRLGLAGIGTSYASYSAKERFHNLRLSIQKASVCFRYSNPYPRFANMVRPGSLSITLIDLRFLIKVETEKHLRKYLQYP